MRIGELKQLVVVVDQGATLVSVGDFGGRSFMLGEPLVYAGRDRRSADYNGGQWDFFELSNGGFYMAPVMPGPLRIEVHGNYYSGTVSADRRSSHAYTSGSPSMNDLPPK